MLILSISYLEQYNKMVESLRTLCLLKVNKIMNIERLEYYDIPEGLLRDLKLVKLFNGSFKMVNEGRFHTTSREMSIFFNGVTWTFSSRTLKNSNLNIPPTIEESKIKVKQDTIVKGMSPLCNMKDFMDEIYELVATEDKKAQQVEADVVMKMAVKIIWEIFAS